MTNVEKQQIYAARHPEKIKERNSKRDFKSDYEKSKIRMRDDPRAYLLKCAKKRSKSNGRECTITVDDILIPTHCPVLGLELTTLSTKTAAPNSMTIDRVDNNRGYTPDNILVISYRANSLKKDATVSELQAIVDFYKEKEPNNWQT